jgi:DNA repair protein RecN (Recombination protein N)
MMAGATITEAALAHAGALIDAARLPAPERGARAVPARAAARRTKAGARAAG